MTYIKAVRGCRECHRFARKLYFASEEFGNAKVRFQRTASDFNHQTLIDRKAVTDGIRDAFSEHLIDHPPATPRAETTQGPLTVVESNTIETRTETYRLTNGELRDFPGSTVAGRKYQVEVVTVITERQGDGEWAHPTIHLTGPVIKADGKPGGGKPGRETLTEQELPDWIADVLGNHDQAA